MWKFARFSYTLGQSFRFNKMVKQRRLAGGNFEAMQLRVADVSQAIGAGFYFLKSFSKF